MRKEPLERFRTAQAVLQIFIDGKLADDSSNLEKWLNQEQAA